MDKKELVRAMVLVGLLLKKRRSAAVSAQLVKEVEAELRAVEQELEQEQERERPKKPVNLRRLGRSAH
jgi:hypothetical protein